MEQKVTRMRPGTVGICASLKHKYDIDPVPHVLCGGFSKEETEDALIELNFLGIKNILAIQGDNIRQMSADKSGKMHNFFARDLVKQIKNMN